MKRTSNVLEIFHHKNIQNKRYKILAKCRNIFMCCCLALINTLRTSNDAFKFFFLDISSAPSIVSTLQSQPRSFTLA